MARALYSIIFFCLLPFIVLRLFWRGRANAGYRQRTAERFGRVPQPAFDRSKPVIWLHAVSVGETIAATPLVKALQAAHPDWQWVITCTTPTGSEQVRRSFGETIYHVYAPYDLPCFIHRFLDRVKPDVAIIMETELWPNTLAALAARSIPSVLANARLSARSARGYQRLSALTRPMLQDLSVVACQQQADGERFITLGLPAAKLHITGNIKFDIAVTDTVQAKAKALRANWQPSRPLWIAASTHPGEDDIILAAHATLLAQHPELLLLLVPRHPERFEQVYQQAAAQFATVKRSSNQPATATTQVIIGDSMGELMALYGCADIAFVGGSLVPVGGHNLIEPAYWQLPLISGPHLFNFSEVHGLLDAAGALSIVHNADNLAAQIGLWLTQVQLAKQAGQNALEVALNNRGALAKLCQIVEQQLADKDTNSK